MCLYLSPCFLAGLGGRRSRLTADVSVQTLECVTVVLYEIFDRFDTYYDCSNLQFILYSLND